jgi:hypothetical protein
MINTVKILLRSETNRQVGNNARSVLIPTLSRRSSWRASSKQSCHSQPCLRAARSGVLVGYVFHNTALLSRDVTINTIRVVYCYNNTAVLLLPFSVPTRDTFLSSFKLQSSAIWHAVWAYSSPTVSAVIQRRHSQAIQPFLWGRATARAGSCGPVTGEAGVRSHASP